MSDIDVVADGLAEALNGNPDYAMAHMVIFEGETYMMMLGPHGQHRSGRSISTLATRSSKPDASRR